MTTKLKEIVIDKWYPDWPFEILNGSINSDVDTKKLFLQLKLFNLSDKYITAIYMNFTCFDITGDAVSNDNNISFINQDLNVSPKSKFERDCIIELPNDKTRKITIELKKVVFSDGEVLRWDEPSKGILIPKLALIDTLGDLTNEHNRIDVEYNSFEKKYIPAIHEEFWSCCCGKMNFSNSTKCNLCGRDKEKQFKLVDREYLQKSLEQYKIEQEEKRQQDLKRLEVKRQREINSQEIEKNKLKHQEEIKLEHKLKQRQILFRWVKIIVTTFVVVIILINVNSFIIQPYIKFSNGEKAFKNGNYLEAINCFKQIPNYKDAKNKLTLSETLDKYSNGEKDFKSGDYAGAEKWFLQTPEYKDTKNKIKQCETIITYNNGEKSFESGDYDTAISLYTQIQDYKDSKDKITLCKYNAGEKAFENGDYEGAMNLFTQVIDYKDSNDKITQCETLIKYSNGESDYEIGDYETSISLFQQIINYSDSKEKILLCNQKITEISEGKELINKYLQALKNNDIVTMNSCTTDVNIANYIQNADQFLNSEYGADWVSQITINYKEADYNNGDTCFVYYLTGNPIIKYPDDIKYIISEQKLELSYKGYNGLLNY